VEQAGSVELPNDERLPDGSKKPGEGLCVGLVPDLEQKAGTTVDSNAGDESPTLRPPIYIGAGKLSRITEVQGCDTRDDDSSTTAGYIIFFILLIHICGQSCNRMFNLNVKKSLCLLHHELDRKEISTHCHPRPV
jgi:hypothetical protein